MSEQKRKELEAEIKRLKADPRIEVHHPGSELLRRRLKRAELKLMALEATETKAKSKKE